MPEEEEAAGFSVHTKDGGKPDDEWSGRWEENKPRRYYRRLPQRSKKHN